MKTGIKISIISVTNPRLLLINIIHVNLSNKITIIVSEIQYTNYYLPRKIQAMKRKFGNIQAFSIPSPKKGLT